MTESTAPQCAIGQNVRVKVVSVEGAVTHTLKDGSSARFAEAIVGDESAQIVLTARDDLLVPETTLEVLNGKVEMFKGWMRLTTDRWGAVRKSSEAVEGRVGEKNLSCIEYELVERAS